MLRAGLNGVVDALRAWVASGADINVADNDGDTPLMLAATWPEIVAMLLTVGAEVMALGGMADD